ncbi:hypothetical protein G7K_2449-t1 [Saitoella complicata NRRL Y-17804]|uniref:DASH complex subunit DAD2 n=1 Tax=Saitoella complicata (strain BCRC 22490 / CBS 7301 / JCM 7358 / NBRC 10748 / NRRL Y-17804) TaxID=698492 RepID=A0A0E9NFT3_SAICN|nr:hypothetical protein G7K_2449-t1 [Saitoella complicata NRRL Y-17804]
MSYNPHARSAYASANPALAARLAEKQREYENLLQLRDLSAGLAAQMEQLEGKLETLTNGTEAVATVLANWQNVFRAINLSAARLGKQDPPEEEEEEEEKTRPEEAPELPETLVRIPMDAFRSYAHAIPLTHSLSCMSFIIVYRTYRTLYSHRAPNLGNPSLSKHLLRLRPIIPLLRREPLILKLLLLLFSHPLIDGTVGSTTPINHSERRSDECTHPENRGDFTLFETSDCTGRETADEDVEGVFGFSEVCGGG